MLSHTSLQTILFKTTKTSLNHYFFNFQNIIMLHSYIIIIFKGIQATFIVSLIVFHTDYLEHSATIAGVSGTGCSRFNVKDENRKICVAPGENVIIKCSSIFPSGNYVLNNRNNPSQSPLAISNVSTEQAGVYKCVSTHPPCNRNRSYTIEVYGESCMMSYIFQYCSVFVIAKMHHN